MSHKLPMYHCKTKRKSCWDFNTDLFFGGGGRGWLRRKDLVVTGHFLHFQNIRK